jgi:putative transcriptional regulator
MDNKKFAKLIESAKQAKEHAEGKRELRTTILPQPLPLMDKIEVVKIRESLNFSQAVFAKYLNVSIKTVQSWEQGIGKPSGASLKLLSIIKNKPTLLIELSA